MWTKKQLNLIQIPVLQDNFIYILHDQSAGKTLVVDPAEAQPVEALLEEKGWRLDLILNTHHHNDHTGGNLALKSAYSCEVYASEYDQERIPGITRRLRDGDSFRFGSANFQVLETPGHTLGHITYFMPDTHWLFCGDTLFSLGCGRLFEGKPKEMWSSLEKLRSLPDDSLVFCTHEYTLANARFAESLPWTNPAQKRFIAHCRALQADGKFTVPSSLAHEKACNPFLQADNPAMRMALGLDTAHPDEVFGKIRAMKDRF